MLLQILRRTAASRLLLRNYDRSHPVAGGLFAQYAGSAIRTSIRHIHTLEQCPSPTCPCRETPQGLEIDHEKPLAGTMPSYAEHVVVSTGKSNWPSKIEDDETTPVVRELKQRLGRDGKFSNVSCCITRTCHRKARDMSLEPSVVYVLNPLMHVCCLVTLGEPEKDLVQSCAFRFPVSCNTCQPFVNKT